MTLREELYAIAVKVKEKGEEHELAVREHLEKVCRYEAQKGNFEVRIMAECLTDGTKLTKKDVKNFAKANDLDFSSFSDTVLGWLYFGSKKD